MFNGNFVESLDHVFVYDDEAIPGLLALLGPEHGHHQDVEMFCCPAVWQSTNLSFWKRLVEEVFYLLHQDVFKEFSDCCF